MTGSKSPWRKKPHFKSYLILLLFLFLLLLGFLPLFRVIEDGTFLVFALLPLIAGGLLGFRLGILYWMLQCLLTSFLAVMAGKTVDDFFSMGIFTYILTLALAAGMGKISDLNKRLRHELKERKRIQNELRQTLEERKQTQVQLIQASKLASIGELASGVAHELNQPLMVIRTMCQMRLRNHPKENRPSPDKIFEDLELVFNNTNRMMKIIDHLKTFSRKDERNFEPIAVNDFVRNCFIMLGEQLRLRNIKLKLNLTESLPPIMGNAIQLEQVILNVMVNARDAIEADHLQKNVGGVIEVVTGMCKAVPTDVEIFIKDTGCGIMADVGKIFDPFFTTKEVGKGTGLGLSISYGIITTHKGKIEVTRTGPGGTTFRIALPVIKPVKKEVASQMQARVQRHLREALFLNSIEILHLTLRRPHCLDSPEKETGVKKYRPVKTDRVTRHFASREFRLTGIGADFRSG